MKLEKGIFWIARDVDGSLYLYDAEPSCFEGFYYGGAVFSLLPSLCPDIRHCDGPRRVLLDISISYIED